MIEGSSIFKENSVDDKERIKDFEDPYEIVDELEKIINKRIRGRLRKVLEFIAMGNLSRHYPTRKEIANGLEFISSQSLKKILGRAVKKGLLVIHPEKKGHGYQYVIPILQDYEENKIKLRKNNVDDTCSQMQIELFVTVLFRIISEFISKNKLMFHHISFSSELNDEEDYTRLSWDIPSIKNKSKKYEFRCSRHRSCDIIISPNGNVSIAVKCSKEPFDLFSIEGINDLNAVCGQILQKIKDWTDNFQPLKADIPEWKIVQIDAAYDIPLYEMTPELVKIINIGKRQDNLISVWPKCLRIKHFNQVYQIYLKTMPTQGLCLRLERQFAFKDLQPTVDEFKKQFGGGKDLEIP